MKKKLAFTLAEVLITLGIIGVVAAMTIPTLMQKTNQKENIAKVNKALNTINNATKLAEAFNGPVDKWDIDYTNISPDTAEKFTKIIIPYLNVNDECSSDSLSRCMYDGVYKKLNGTNHSSYLNNTHAIVLNNGTVMFFRPTTADTHYITCYVDINGKKGPNQIGVDLFNFLLYKKSKTFEAEHADDCNKESTGWGCADYILQNKNMNYLQ